MKNRITIILAVTALLLFLTSVGIYLLQDHKAPVINVSNETITYTEGEDTSSLLTGINAFDKMDGDLTSSVRIYDITVLDSGNEAVVTYVVYDKSNNMGKISRRINYVPVADESGVTEETVVTDENEVADNSSAEGQENGESEVSENETQETAAEDLNADNTDEQPDTENRPEETNDNNTTADENSVNEAPVIRLNTTEAHIAAGTAFNSMNYVASATDDKDSREQVYRSIILEGYYDTQTPGAYELSYYCVDSEGKRSNTEKLILYVD